MNAGYTVIRTLPALQYQKGPGLDAELDSRADLGEKTYRGSGRLAGRRALVTGGDSGIGAATVIAFAREGADVVISYLPEEEQDAQRIKGFVEDAGRTAVLLPGDWTKETYCTSLVQAAVKELGGLDIVVSNGGKQQHVEELADLSTEQFDETSRPTFMRCSGS